MNISIFCGYKGMKLEIFLVGILVSGGIVPAYSAQLDVDIPSDATEITPSYKFLRLVTFGYPDGGELADILADKQNKISFTADSQTPEVSEIISQMNSQLSDSLSGAFVSDLTIKYQAILDVKEKSAKLEYNIQMEPTIQNPIVIIGSERYIDSDWRGIKLSGPIMLETQYGMYDINNPESALQILAPELLMQIQDADAKEILNIELLDASGIKALSLSRWHSLFDPTGILEESKQANFSGNSVITHYSMGECTIVIGICDDREWKAEFVLDKKYTIIAKESRDDATISLEGYGSVKQIGDSEIFSMTERPANTGPVYDFPVGIIYGMAAMAAIGGVLIFIISNRKLKAEQGQTEQTGIDPSRLRSYATHAGAGGYQTVRGEAQLIDDTDYQKTRSVYDEKQESKSKGALPKGWN